MATTEQKATYRTSFYLFREQIEDMRLIEKETYQSPSIQVRLAVRDYLAKPENVKILDAKRTQDQPDTV